MVSLGKDDVQYATVWKLNFSPHYLFHSCGEQFYTCNSSSQKKCLSGKESQNKIYFKDDGL